MAVATHVQSRCRPRSGAIMKIHERLALLMLNPDSGKLNGGERGRLSLATAGIADLLIDGCFQLDANTRLRATGVQPDHPTLINVYNALLEYPQRKLYKHISSNERQAAALTLAQLTQTRILQAYEDTTWLIFPCERHRLADSKVLDELVETIHAALADLEVDIPPAMAALLALAHDARVLEPHIPTTLSIGFNERLQRLAEDSQYAQVLRYVIKARDAASTAASVAVSGASIG